MAAKWLDRGLLFSSAYLGLCTTEKQWKKVCKAHKVKDAPNWIGEGANASTHRIQWKNKTLLIVCIRKPCKHSVHAIHALLVHEAVHMWQYIKEDLGETQPSPEMEAYAVQNLSFNLMEAYAAS